MVAIGDIVMSINNINVHQIKNQWEVMEMIQNALLAAGDGVGEGIPKCIITFKRPIPPITLREQDIFADPHSRHSYRETDGTAHYYRLLEYSYDKYYHNDDINNRKVLDRRKELVQEILRGCKDDNIDGNECRRFLKASKIININRNRNRNRRRIRRKK
jgi:hypothetical protein